MSRYLAAHIRSLISITGLTGKGEIFCFGTSTVFDANDMIYVASMECIRLVNKTIFTFVICPFCYKEPQRVRNILAHAARIK